MGLIQLGLDEWRPTREPAKRSITLADFPWLKDLLSANQTTAGVVVNEHTALNFSAYFNGVDIISGQIGITPRIPYRRLSDDERERATTHPTYRLLHDEPNPMSTPAVFWQTVMAHVLTWGNGYAEIEWDNALRPIALWNLTPDTIDPKVETVTLSNGRSRSRLYYIYKGQRRIEAEDIIHVPGLGFDGIRGYSIVHMARRSLGLAAAAEQYASSFYARGATPAITVEHPKTLTPKAKTNIKDSIDDEHGGPFKAGGTLVLEEGMTAKVLGIPQKDAQFLESREFSIVEVARWLNMPPHKLKHKYGERPGGNLEAAQIEFLTDTLDPWYVRVEQECSRKLFPANQRNTYYVEHMREARLRMDSGARIAEQKAYFDMGVLDAEQIAKQQNLPKPDERVAPLTQRIENVGQLVRAGFDPEESLQALGLPRIKHLGTLPVTVQPPEEPPAAAPADPEPPPEADARVAAAQRALLMDAAARFIKIEGERVKRGAKRGAAEFEEWLNGRRDEDRETLRATLLPALRVIVAHRGAGDVEALAERLAAEHVESSREALLALPARGLAEHVERLVGTWDTARALELAERAMDWRE